MTLTLLISLFLPLSTTFLIPIDISSPNNSQLMSILWKLNYWITFFATWLILPFWQYFLSNGQFELLPKIKSSIYSVFKFLLILIIIGIVIFIYMLFYHIEYINFTFLKSLVITLSHIYALTMAIWLMIHGLIHLPKSSYLKSSYSKTLDNSYLKIRDYQLKLEDSKFELKDICIKINSLHDLINNSNFSINLDIQLRDGIIYMFNHIPENFKLINNNFNNNNQQFLIDSIGISIDKITLNFITKLNEDLKWKIWEYNHSNSQFNEQLKEILYYEDIINYINLSNFESEWRNFNYKWPKFMFQYVWPFYYLIITFLFTLISLIIIESEMFHGTKLSILNWIINLNSKFSYILMVIFLIIMMSCSMKSLSLIKLFNIYKVEFNSNSDPVSSIFFISYALRLTIPLGYNFLMLLNPQISENSSFSLFVTGNLHLIKIGEILNNIIPRLVLIPVLLSVFGIWGKLRKWLDGYLFFDYILDEIELYEENETIDTNLRLINEGKSIAQSSIQRNLIPLNDTTMPNFSFNQSSNFSIWNYLPFSLFKNRNNNNGFNIDDDDDNNIMNGLREYNLINENGILLESRRNSSNSDGGSSYSGVSGNYDIDNRVMGDEFIRNIRE